MKSEPRGINTSELEVTSITREGVWLSLQGRELCLTFENFPWFRDASVAAIMNVQLTHPDHLYWPDLDVDLAVESVVYPERFPLVAK